MPVRPSRADPGGPSFDATLVGIIATPGAFADLYAITVFSPAVLDQPVGIVATEMTVRLDPGLTRADLRAEIDGLADGSLLSVTPGQVIAADVRNAVDAQAQGVGIMAIVGAIATMIALGQLLSRHARLPDVERRPLVALGVTRDQLAMETLARAAVPAAAGVVLGAGVAIAASGRFPVGFARTLEPRLGTRVDAVALAVVGAVLLVALLVWVGVVWRATTRRDARPTPSPASEAMTRRAPSAASATGTHFALTGRDGSSTSAFGTVLVLAIIVGGVIGAAVFAASLSRLVSDPIRSGGFPLVLGDLSDLSAPDLRASLEGDRDIAGLMILSEGRARVGATTVGITGVEYVHGDLVPSVLSGRLPSRPDEVALGRVAARDLGAQVGDTLDVAGAGGQGAYRVVGLAVVPGIGGNDGVGQGGVMTMEGLGRVDPEPGSSLAAVVLRPGAPTGTSDRLARLVGADSAGSQDPPSVILNVARVREIPGVLAGLLAALAVLTMLHTTIVSVQARRRDLAVLRALGADRRWIARAVRWQATAITVLPFLIGVRLGLIAGRTVFRAFADRIGVVSDPATPIVVASALLLGLLVLANLVAIVPVRRARRIVPARLLGVE
ncbi:MAG TPA: ABC transporter permease [Nocardioidaceae bacterium]|nr:ABC transporter permease [Nocardioidaceae bacterium]